MTRFNEGSPAGTVQTRRLALYGTDGAVQRCRDFSRQALLDWHWLPARDEERQALVEDLLLMVSELVTNACLHAPGGPAELRLSWDGTRLWAGASDDSPVPPRLSPHPDPARPGGHGLGDILGRLRERLDDEDAPGWATETG
ncbi:hypothetical protein GCM10009760_49570 [Kitasatospora kazusensis]|uniref:ATP-binding protein n=1 Tax=Kitasatospora kazusensis TaxID=407974 RepID=A0ABN3A2S2_9ACTN